MAGATFSQTIGIQLEKVRPKLELLIQQDDTLFSLIKEKAEGLETSGRATRIPFKPLAGGKTLQISADGGDMGQGSVFTTDAFTLTPVYFSHALQWSKQTEVSTKGGEKAIVNWFSEMLKDGTNQFSTNLEAIIQGDGSNTLDTVVSTATNQIVVNNANQFYDNQDIIVFSALGGTNRGTATISSVDANNKTLNLTAAVPSGTTAGDLLLVNGSSGAVVTSTTAGMYGVKYFQLQSNTGSVLGINRSQYPGKLSTPHVNANNTALTPAMGRRAKSQIQIALGINAVKEQQLMFHMNLDQAAAWENLGIAVAGVQQQALKGSTSIDMLQKDLPATFAGHPMTVSIHATPGRIDGLCLKNWGRVYTQKPDFYEVANQTLFPAYGASGGVATSTLAYVWTGMNIFNANPRAGVYIDNLPIPVGY